MTEFEVTEGRAKKLRCERCGGSFQGGDRVVSRDTSTHRKHYHVSCWEALFYVPSGGDSDENQ